MVLDVTHTSDESVRQAMDIFAGPVVATHQNCRALVPGERQFPGRDAESSDRARGCDRHIA